MKATEQFKLNLVAMLPRLYRYARNLSRSDADADDLLQATCTRILDRWTQFQPDSDFDRWAFTVMSSINHNHLRSARTRQGAGLVDAADELSSSDTPERNKFREQVFVLIENLPEKQRQVILLVYLEGFTYQEAADILSVPVGTVMSRIARGRARLAKALVDTKAVETKADAEKRPGAETKVAETMAIVQSESVAQNTEQKLFARVCGDD